MAFQLDSNVFHKQKSLSDYMAVNEARDLQRAQVEQGMKASNMSIEAAQRQAEMDTLGRGLAGATEQDYPQRREALIKQGVPPQFLPEQFTPSYVDAILTKTGYKSKPSGLATLMSPSGTPMIIDKTTGQYMKATEIGRPLSDMVGVMPEPTQEAAPVTPQGSITTQPVGDIDQYANDSGSYPAQGKSLDDAVSMAREMQAGTMPMPAPNTQEMLPAEQTGEPTSIPLPQPLPQTTLNSTIAPKQLPRPTITGNDVADQKALEDWQAANLELQKKALTPPTAKERMAETSKKRAQSGFDSIMEGMNQIYDDLEAEGAAASENKTWDENLGIYVTKTNPVAQVVGKLGGTKAASIMQRLDPLKTRAKEQIMMATGMSSKAIDSNAEMKSFLDSLTDVTNTREANAFTIQTMQRLYGTPEKAMARDAAIRNGEIEPITDFSKTGTSNAPAGRSTPTPQAIEYLKANPDLADQFEAKYGVKANQYLGQ